MHRLRAWGLTAAALAGAGAATAADPAPAATDTRPWYQRVVGGPPKPAAPARPVVVQPLPPEAVAAALKAEQDALLRRIDVCTQLRMVAEDADDDGLRRQCDELERQANALYAQRTAALGIKKVKAPLAAASLDRALGTGAAVTPLAVPPSPTPADAARTAQLREGQP